MREVPKPPPVDLAAVVTKFNHRLNDDDVKKYLAKAETEYLHWDTLRHMPKPDGITKEEGWGLVKFTRISWKFLPLWDEQNAPFRYTLPNAISEVLHDLDQHASGLLILQSGESETISGLGDRVLISSLMDEAIATSKIEGAVTTWKVAQAMLREGRKPIDKSEQMILNSYNMMQKLKTRLDEPLSVEMLHQIQTEITYKTLENPEHSGRFRAEKDEVHVVDQRDGERVFTPPHAKHLGTRIQKLIKFANSPSVGAEFIHPFVKAAILHFWLAYEHPYCDGNGRTARALIYWYLLKHKYWLFQYLPLSKVVVEAPMQYYRSFVYSEHDENDLTYSISYMAGAARKAIRKLKQDLVELRTEQQALSKTIQKIENLNYRQRAILKELIAAPTKTVSIQYQKNTHNVTYQTARNDLLELAKQGYLRKLSIKKKFLFVLGRKLKDK